jgi:hypothetical protein
MSPDSHQASSRAKQLGPIRYSGHERDALSAQGLGDMNSDVRTANVHAAGEFFYSINDYAVLPRKPQPP